MSVLWSLLWLTQVLPPAAGDEVRQPPAEVVSAEPPAALPAAVPAAIEIVFIGAVSDRREMETAVHTVLGEEADLAWSSRTTAPGDGPPSPAASDGMVQIWIDVSQPSRVRIVLPARAPAAAPVVRTVDDTADGAEGHRPVLREAVAQIVAATVRALREEAPTRSGTVASAPALAPAPDRVEISQHASSPRPSQLLADGERPPYSLALVAGNHTSPFRLSGKIHKTYDPFGLAVGLSVRRETRRFSFEARATVETSSRSSDTIDLQNQFYSVSVAAARRFVSGRVTFSAGLEAGALLLRQRALAGDQLYGFVTPPNLALPGQLGITWSAGGLAGPIAALSVDLSRRLFLHFVAAVPVVVMNVDGGDDTGFRASWYTQLLGGLGVYL